MSVGKWPSKLKASQRERSFFVDSFDHGFSSLLCALGWNLASCCEFSSRLLLLDLPAVQRSPRLSRSPRALRRLWVASRWTSPWLGRLTKGRRAIRTPCVEMPVLRGRVESTPVPGPCCPRAWPPRSPSVEREPGGFTVRGWGLPGGRRRHRARSP